MTRHGITLIEVILALALLAMLSVAVVGLARDVRAAAEIDPGLASIDQATLSIEDAVGELAAPLHTWETGHIEYTANGTMITRRPCPDCPGGLGRFEFLQNAIVLTRFEPVTEEQQTKPTGSVP
ncbi:MAG: prepilin-type N-terminal cleavage/methylation domain-containing protein [Planctomycetota bacterium]